MTLRRFAIAPLLALATFACTQTVPSNPNTAVPTAEWDPTTGVIPLPNDLAISPLLNPALVHPQNAQDELLAYFHAQGGFPADQVVPLAFPLAVENISGPGAVVNTPPDIDLATVVPCTGLQAPGGCNLFVFEATGQPGAQYPAYAVTYAKGTTSGTLSATPVASGKPTTWKAGATYFYALRGGSSGVKTTGGQALNPSASMYTLIFGGPGDFQCASTVPPQDCQLTSLAFLKAQYAPVFAAIQNKGFPVSDTVVLGTFQVMPATTWVVADPGTGTVPVPSNFLLDPVTRKVSSAAAAAFGIPALASLDGFSTTAMDIAQTSGPVLAGTIRSSTDQGVYLYKVSGATATQVGTVYVEPPPITLDPGTGQACAPVNAQGDFGPTCVSTLVGIQPALTVPTLQGPVALPPLAEKSTYAVIVTEKVKDPTGAGISKTTLGQILLFDNPLCTPSPGCVANPTAAVSELPGVSGEQAAGLEGMRLQLKPVVAQLASDHGVTKSQIAMPYTFLTQSITDAALQLGAAPYAKNPLTGTDAFPDAPAAAAAVTPAAMAAKWGVPPALLASGISTFVEAGVVTVDVLDPNTGAFYATTPIPPPTPVIPAIVAIPATPAPAAGWPLVVFHHGLGRSRGDMLLAAQALAGSGMVVAAIDAAKHGARAWCQADTVTGVAVGCAAGVQCDTTVFANQPTDPPTARPGLCKGPLQNVPIACDPTVTPGCWNGTGGNSVTSGDFLISANLFRSRDTLRQDILDQSMLVRVLTSANGQAVLSAAAGSAVAVDPSRVFYVGQDLGALEGTPDLAANPRFSRAVLNVGGATIVDILSTSPAFQSSFLDLLASIGIAPGTEEYLLFNIGAKWILDPADPANFAANLSLQPLPNLLAGGVPQAAKAILGQAALCDTVDPNPTNQLLYGLAGLSPLQPTVAASSPGLQWFMSSAAGTCPASAVDHGFLLDWTDPARATAAQQNVASFLLGGPVAATPVVVP